MGDSAGHVPCYRLATGELLGDNLPHDLAETLVDEALDKLVRIARSTVTRYYRGVASDRRARGRVVR